jgi:hypothetical protein
MINNQGPMTTGKIASSPPKQITNWARILWQECRACGDRDYAQYLRRTLWAAPWSWFYGFSFGRQPRPYAAEVEAALEAACEAQPAIHHLWQGRLARLEEARQKNTPIKTLVDDLQENHWFERFTARHALFYRGGEAVEGLLHLVQMESPQAQVVALWLLQSIGVETSRRLAQQAGQLLCTRCVVHCHHFELEIARGGQIDYYGCRACHQSRAFQSWPGGVVAVLDRASRTIRTERNDQIRVNWLAQRIPFDFDQVEVLAASDEEVERFAVQVGNDTDEIRKPAYKKMGCTVSSTCGLSENTLRILEHTFGSVQTTVL